MGIWAKTIGAIMALGLVASCGSSGDQPESQKTKTITVSAFTKSPVSTVDQLVVRKGFLKAEGVNAKILEIPSGPNMVASLLGGTSQVTGGAPSLVWPLLNQGTCVKYLAPGLGNMYNIIARPDVKLPNINAGFPASVRDLKGKTIGIVARGSATENWVGAVLKDAGMDPKKDVTFIAVGAAPTALAAFEQKKVDAVLSYPPLEQMLAKDGVKYQVVADMVHGKPDTMANMLQVGSVMTCEYAEKNPDVVTAYCKAINKAYAFMDDPANKDEMGAFMSTTLGVDAATGPQIWEQIKGSFPAKTFNKEIWAEQVKFLPDPSTPIPDYDKFVVPNCG